MVSEVCFSILIAGLPSAGTMDGILARRKKGPFADCQFSLGAAGTDHSFTPGGAAAPAFGLVGINDGELWNF